ncbi:hypothetical protein [Mycetocola saprophilus]|uniref:hypothetical protein n=1 Tax=Mycetocola saprophilus TaxID=76636 RepID=UPI00068CC444|nr:hypothetical protein [Mycetocola saprophilus]
MGKPKPYATPEDYATWTGETIQVSPVLLRRAEIRVRSMLTGVVYPVDADGNATDPEHIQALMEATCAQAAFFEDTGDISGSLAVLGGASIGTVKLGTPTTAAGGKGSAVDLRYSSEVADILAAAGLDKRTVVFRT